VNKLWNASRFILLNAADVSVPEQIETRKLDIGSKWILSRLSATAQEINGSLGDYRFNDAAGSIYQFIWHELCDWYIEMVKPVLYAETDEKKQVKECLLYVLDHTLKLLHPFMPYVTEEIWQNIPIRSRKSEEGNQISEHAGARYLRPSSEDKSIVIARYPEGQLRDEKAEEEMAVIMEAVTGVRTIRGELNLSPSIELKVSVKTLNEKTKKILKKNLVYLKKLAKADIIAIGGDTGKPKGSAAAVRKHVEVYVPLEGLLNIDLEVDRLSKEGAKLEQTILFLNKKLLNEDFLSRAPKDVVDKEKEKYEECLRKQERVQENIRKLCEAGGKA